jgi:hypothetical protein
MSQPLITQVEVSLTAAGGAAPTKRVWANPISQPFRDTTIWVSSRGLTLAAGNLDWEVFYGGAWSGVPFAAASTHAGGRSQGSGSLAGSIEYADVIYEDSSILPTNARIGQPNAAGTDMGINGFPVVVSLDNKKAAAITVYVTFISRTLSDPV